MGIPRYIYKKLMLLFYIASPFLFFFALLISLIHEFQAYHRSVRDSKYIGCRTL